MFIGTAAWNIPKISSQEFPVEGSHLERYCTLFNGVEINSSFYKEHGAKTYERWASTVPQNFKFSVKLSQTFTHDSELQPVQKDLEASLERILKLGQKLGVILIQFPGSQDFEVKKMLRFYKLIRKSFDGPLAIEPRNTTWINADSRKMMLDFGVSKVIADPEKCEGGGVKLSSAGGLTYFRLHGAPITYRSSYSQKYLKDLSLKLKTVKNPWCIFDNTTFGYATQNAIDLSRFINRLG